MPTDIDRGAPVLSTLSVEINASPATVWLLHTDIVNWHRWPPDIDSVRLKGDLEAGSKFRWKSRGFSIKSRVEEMESQRRIVWSGRAKGTRVMHAWTFDPIDGGVRVTTEESMRGWLPRLFRRYIQRSLDEGLESWLRNLKFKAEAVEAPAPPELEASPASAPES